jgi:carboxypeptidase Taq
MIHREVVWNLKGNSMARSAEEAYAELVRREKERALLGSCAGVLGWDERTYMPTQGVVLRAEQLALLARLNHERLTAAEMGALLTAAEGGDGDATAAANVRRIRRLYDRAVKMPPRLVEELARAAILGQQAWQVARRQRQFSLFRPHLERIVELKRQEAAAVGYTQTPYDALLDEFEPGATTAEIEQTFMALRQQLAPLVAGIVASGVRAPVEVLRRDYPVDRQRIFAESAAAAVGFDFAAGRLDVTAHPFCTGIGPGDVRICTRYDPQFFSAAFFGVLHEAGHGIYEQQLDREQFGLPAGTPCSLGIHESQSRLWENYVGRSRPFWEHFFPRARQTFFESLGDVSLDSFYFAVNDVRPSFIRVEADEATYNLHIILRFQLEQALVSGDLPASDLPMAWKEKFQEFFHLTPGDDAEGCLQDIHWGAGLFGYFPTYTLGNLYAAQFMEAARRELGDLDEPFRRGEFTPLKEWLAAKIHRHGQRYPAAELCRRVTGQPLSPEPLMRHLHAKFAPLYGV